MDASDGNNRGKRTQVTPGGPFYLLPIKALTDEHLEPHNLRRLPARAAKATANSALSTEAHLTEAFLSQDPVSHKKKKRGNEEDDPFEGPTQSKGGLKASSTPTKPSVKRPQETLKKEALTGPVRPFVKRPRGRPRKNPLPNLGLGSAAKIAQLPPPNATDTSTNKQSASPKPPPAKLASSNGKGGKRRKIAKSENDKVADAHDLDASRPSARESPRFLSKTGKDSDELQSVSNDGMLQYSAADISETSTLAGDESVNRKSLVTLNITPELLRRVTNRSTNIADTADGGPQPSKDIGKASKLVILRTSPENLTRFTDRLEPLKQVNRQENGPHQILPSGLVTGLSSQPGFFTKSATSSLRFPTSSAAYAKFHHETKASSDQNSRETEEEAPVLGPTSSQLATTPRRTSVQELEVPTSALRYGTILPSNFYGKPTASQASTESRTTGGITVLKIPALKSPQEAEKTPREKGPQKKEQALRSIRAKPETSDIDEYSEVVKQFEGNKKTYAKLLAKVGASSESWLGSTLSVNESVIWPLRFLGPPPSVQLGPFLDSECIDKDLGLVDYSDCRYHTPRTYEDAAFVRKALDWTGSHYRSLANGDIPDTNKIDKAMSYIAGYMEYQRQFKWWCFHNLSQGHEWNSGRLPLLFKLERWAGGFANYKHAANTKDVVLTFKRRADWQAKWDKCAGCHRRGIWCDKQEMLEHEHMYKVPCSGCKELDMRCLRHNRDPAHLAQTESSAHQGVRDRIQWMTGGGYFSAV